MCGKTECIVMVFARGKLGKFVEFRKQALALEKRVVIAVMIRFSFA